MNYHIIVMLLIPFFILITHVYGACIQDDGTPFCNGCMTGCQWGYDPEGVIVGPCGPFCWGNDHSCTSSCGNVKTVTII